MKEKEEKADSKKNRWEDNIQDWTGMDLDSKKRASKT